MEGQAKEEEALPKLSLGGEKLKRDEWNEGAVDCLLQSYESKWILRNRAKLKGQDWEDVARQVSDASRSAKTATQCKNKIESMKKRYRNEVAAGSRGSRWPLFSKIDGLVRCRASMAPSTSMLMVIDEKQPASYDQLDQADAGAETAQSAELNGVAEAAAAPAAAQENHIQGDRVQTTETGKEVDQNEPSYDSSKEKQEIKNKKEKRKRINEDGNLEEVVESIQWLGEVILRVEQTRMEAMREVEKIRAEMEARKGDMDLKRTEIIANTQLQIAKLFARRIDKLNSSPRINRD